MKNKCSELGDFCYQIELVHYYYDKYILRTKNCPGVGFFERMVWANSLSEAIERVKSKWEYENREGRKKGLQIHVPSEQTRLIPEVHKTNMYLEEYEVLRERRE